MLPEDISDPDQVEETIQMLMDIGIEVLESTTTLMVIMLMRLLKQ